MQQVVPVVRVLWSKFPCRSLFVTLLAACIGVAAGRNLLGRISVVSGMSMAPTFEPGTWVRATPITGDLARGDIVILDDGKTDYAMKRIVGLPGETVHIWRGYVFINRRILLEPYLAKCVYTFPRERQAVFLLGPNQYFVLGDNRPASADSRVYGPVDRDNIKGRVPIAGQPPQPRFGPFVVKPYGEDIRS
jgi:signal peptidase I